MKLSVDDPSREDSEGSRAQQGGWAWLGLAALSQFLWGCYPTVCRLFQLEEQVHHPTLSGLQLSGLVNAIALAALALCYSLPLRLRRRPRRPAQRMLVLPKVEDTGQQQRELWRRRRGGIAGAAALAALSITLIYSVGLTHAYLCQMLFLLSPVFVALLSKWLFRVPLPRRIWPALALTIAGSAMVILGKEADLGTPRLGWQDAAGLGLALVSALSLAAYLVFLQRTKDLLDDEALMWINYGTQAALSLGLTLAMGEDFPTLSASDWVKLAGLALIIQFGASLSQQVTVRKLGPPLAAIFLPTRLLGAVAASAVLLGERLTPTEWAGMLVVLAATSWFLVMQMSPAGSASRRHTT